MSSSLQVYGSFAVHQSAGSVLKTSDNLSPLYLARACSKGDQNKKSKKRGKLNREALI